VVSEQGGEVEEEEGEASAGDDDDIFEQAAEGKLVLGRELELGRLQVGLMLL